MDTVDIGRDAGFNVAGFFGKILYKHLKLGTQIALLEAKLYCYAATTELRPYAGFLEAGL